MTYKFRLRFKLPNSTFINEDTTSTEIKIANCAQRVLLFSRPPSKNFQKASMFDAVCDGFSSKESAVQFGQNIRNTIMICCALLRMGVEIGKHEEILDMSSIKKSKKDQSYVQPENLNGLVVYPSEAKIEHVSMNFSMSSGPELERFQNLFSKSFDLCNNLDEKLLLAFELYNSHFFELSIRAKFLQLVSTVECLAKQKRIKDSIIDHLDGLISSSKEKLPEINGISDDEIDSFVQRLHQLKRESISVACRNLIQQYLGNDEVKFFKECYNIRSKLVHDGTIKDGIDIVNYLHKLNNISRNLLYAIINRNQNSTKC